MKISKVDLFDNNSLVSKQLQQLIDHSSSLRNEADRIDRLEYLIDINIGEGKITDSEQVDTAMAWLEHSQLSPYEIIDKII